MKNIRIAITAVAFGGVFACGCGGKGDARSGDAAGRGLLGPSPKELVAMAFDPDDPDRRREGILRLSETSWGLREPHLKGYALLLRSDEDASVRSAAARALGKAREAKYLPALATALRKDPSPAVRWDAAVALDGVTGPAAAGPLQSAATDDSSADVRAASLRSLRHYRRPDVVRTLIRGLRDPVFAVRHQAHATLVEMTGRDLGHDPDAWSAAAGTLLPAAGEAETK